MFNKESIYSGFLWLLYKEYYKSKDRKIEIINNKFYLNMKLSPELIKFAQGNPKIWNGIKTIIRTNPFDTNKFYTFKKGILTGLDGKPLTKTAHFSKVEGNYIIHSTNNINFKATSFQTRTIAIPALVSKHVNPGTVITRDAKLENISNEKHVPHYQYLLILKLHEELFGSINSQEIDNFFNNLSEITDGKLEKSDIIYREVCMLAANLDRKTIIENINKYTLENIYPLM